MMMNSKRSKLSHLFVIAGLCVSLSSSGSFPQDSPDESRFRIYILKKNWHELGLGYKAENASAILRTLDTRDAICILTEKEIESYDWKKQTLTLTSRTVAALGQALALQQQAENGARADGFTAGMKKLGDLKKKLGWGNAIERALYLKAFVVKLDDSFLYGGVFLDATSQMPLEFPVARFLEGREGRNMISWLPVHMPFVTIDPVAEAGNMQKIAVTPEAKADTEQLEKKENFFSNWIAEIAQSENAQRFRKTIRNEEVKSIFKIQDKLID